MSGQAACIYTDVVDELFNALLILQNHKEYISQQETHHPEGAGETVEDDNV